MAENPIVLAHSETCRPNAGPGSGVAANAPAEGSRTALAVRVAAIRMWTVFMVNGLSLWMSIDGIWD